MQDESWALTDWPFFDASHRTLAARVVEWNRQNSARPENPTPDECRHMARSLGDAGLLRYVVPETGGDFDVRALCLIREGLTFDYGIADSMFAMQGIGTLAIQRSGTDEQKSRYLEGCRLGRRIAAFALTEPDAGSDVASMTTFATRDGAGYVINGAKTLITNAGMADHYIVVARTGEGEGTRGLSAFIVDADVPGLEIGAPIEFMAPHPAGSLTFSDCRVPRSSLIGEPGSGFKVAMAAFDIFRPSVGAAGVGLARRALRETLKRVTTRRLMGKPMGDIQNIQMALADMATDIDTAALAVYRAAWELDVRKPRRSYAPSMAKLCGAEAAGRVVDRAVQLFGGAGVVRGNVIEHLYREARPMRIYEGASEIQKLIIGRQLLADFTAALP
jgi:acyl-CoA dehydrogenase